MGNEHLLVKVENGIMKLTLNRPDSLNAFSYEMKQGIMDALKEARNNDDVRVVTIQGAGRAFSAGGDVKSFHKLGGTSVYDALYHTNELVMAIRSFEKPVIALVHGYAAGAAFNYALSCDMIIAAEGSKFIMSFTKIGLVTDGGGSYFLPRIVGAQRAKELLFSAEPIDAKQAFEWGIVNRVFQADEFEEKAMEFVSKYANGPSKAYEMTKKLVNQSFVSDLDEMLELERLSQVIMMQTEDYKEGIAAFKEKREAKYIGR
ncbi:enoyl-CoA hydratase/isomerase family protein [Neobacillus sp. SAB-20_R2A]|uniref:enoyl-CoA hydratase/isomerase family protein n=1 Tax=Neobacillus sp. SAB-20_R2A TaxID=3120519 RepID=UPI003C6E76B7